MDSMRAEIEQLRADISQAYNLRDKAEGRYCTALGAIEQLHAAVKTAQELAARRLMEIERLREVLTIPNITPDTTSSALFIRTLSEHEKGQPVNGQDLINALMWRVKNQRREIARLHGEAEVADEQLAQLRGFAEAHQTCRGSDEPSEQRYTAEDYERVIAAGGNMWSTLERLREMAMENHGHNSKGAEAFRAFADEHARLMRIRASAPQGASRDASSAEELPPMRFKDWARDIRTQGLLAEIRALKSSHPKYCDDPPTSRT